MKQLMVILSFILVFSCDSEDASDCFQKTGNVIQKEIFVDTFDKVFVNRDIELIIKDGLQPSVIVETGTNLINDVSAVVVDSQLILTDNNSCNFVRDYGITKAYITSPNITEIRSSTQYNIRSDGILTYPRLTILSEDFNAPDTFTNANFILEVDNNELTVVFNNLSNAFVAGKTNTLNVTFAAGTSRFEGRELIAQSITIWNRSSNDMILNPEQEIKGKISGTGDVICVNKPPVVDVEEQYRGRLIFE